MSSLVLALGGGYLTHQIRLPLGHGAESSQQPAPLLHV
jgi:hypothetical protein